MVNVSFSDNLDGTISSVIYDNVTSYVSSSPSLAHSYVYYLMLLSINVKMFHIV